MTSSNQSQQIAEPKWPKNPPWPFVAELEKRVALLEERTAELADMLKELLNALQGQEENDADE